MQVTHPFTKNHCEGTRSPRTDVPQARRGPVTPGPDPWASESETHSGHQKQPFPSSETVRSGLTVASDAKGTHFPNVQRPHLNSSEIEWHDAADILGISAAAERTPHFINSKTQSQEAALFFCSSIKEQHAANESMTQCFLIAQNFSFYLLKEFSET